MAGPRIRAAWRVARARGRGRAGEGARVGRALDRVAVAAVRMTRDARARVHAAVSGPGRQDSQGRMRPPVALERSEVVVNQPEKGGLFTVTKVFGPFLMT